MAYTQQPVPVQVQVIDPTFSNIDSTIGNISGGKSLEMLVAELHGKYYQQCLRGNVFHGATAAAGVLIPVQSTTGPTFAVWNPPGSGKNVELIAAYYGWVSTTGAPANISYNNLNAPGSAVGGTGAPVTAATFGTPKNGLLGAGKTSVTLFVPATATLTAAGTLLGTNGMSQLTTTGASTTGSGWFTMTEWFDGSIIVPPNNFFYPTSENTAELSVFNIRWVWAEVPV